MLKTLLFYRSRLDDKVTVTKKGVTLGHPKIHPQTEIGIPTSNDIGDSHRIRCGF